jgi:hypothetical protein
MAGKMRFLQPLLPGGWLLTGAGAAVLRPSALTLLVAVLQAVVLLVAVWAAAWRQARGHDRAQKLLEATGASRSATTASNPARRRPGKSRRRGKRADPSEGGFAKGDL